MFIKQNLDRLSFPFYVFDLDEVTLFECISFSEKSWSIEKPLVKKKKKRKEFGAFI